MVCQGSAYNATGKTAHNAVQTTPFAPPSALRQVERESPLVLSHVLETFHVCVPVFRKVRWANISGVSSIGLARKKYRQSQPGDVVALLLTPLTRQQASLAVNLTPDAYRRLMAAWIPSQLVKPRRMDEQTIRCELDRLPCRDIHAWRTLGTIVARLVV